MTIKQSVLKRVPKEFIDVVEAMNDDEVKARIVEVETHLYEIARDKESNEKLVEVRTKLKEMMEPYKEAKQVETAKMQFLMNMLEERGKI